MPFAKSLLATAAVLASFGASAVTGSLGGGFGPFLSLETDMPGMKCVPNGTATCALEAPIATIRGGTIYNSDQPFADIPAGSVFESRFLAAGPTSSDPATVLFDSGVGYVSFLWGSPDTYNTLTITESNGTTTTSTNFTVNSFVPPLPGNGNQSFSSYVQFVAAAGYTIRSLSFTSGGVDAFETANYSITPIPEPETYALMLAGLAAMGFVSKRRKQQSA